MQLSEHNASALKRAELMHASAKKALRTQKKTVEDFMALQSAPVKEASAERKALQESIDSKLGVKEGSVMAKYLYARFSLSKGSKPHAMSF